MKIALYARVSTKDKGQTPENQLRRLRDYCNNRGWNYKSYVDYASGAKKNRPGLTSMLKDIKLYDGVLVLRLDRFGRSISNILENLETLRKEGLFFEAIDQGIRIAPDKKDPVNNFVATIIGAAAQLERELGSERVIDGINRAKGGDPYKKVNGRKSIEERFKDRIPRILELREQGLSIRKISEQVGIKKSSVHRLLSGKPPSKKPPSEYINPLVKSQMSGKEIFSGQKKEPSILDLKLSLEWRWKQYDQL